MNVLVQPNSGDHRVIAHRRSATELAGNIVDVLRLSDRELINVLSRMSDRVDPDERPMRWRRIGSADDLPRTLVRICHQRGNCTTYLVKPRDIHEHGIVFLHGSFVHQGASCAVLLRTRDGQPTQIAATVMQCRHVSGRVHEVHAEFAKRAIVGEYLWADGSPVLQGNSVVATA